MAMSSSVVTFATTVGVFALLAIGMNIKFGYTGLLEIGHVAFFLIGAYVTALLVLPPAAQNPGQIYILGLDLPWTLGLLGGVLAAATVGALVSLPAIRLREDYLAIVLLGIAFIIQQIFRSPSFRWLANGPRALAGFERPLVGLFPLPGDTVGSILLFGVVVFLFWFGAVYALSWVMESGGPPRAANRVARAAFAVTTLGVGYWFARRTLGTDRPTRIQATAAGFVVGGITAVAMAATPTALNQLIGLLVVGAYSLFTWVLAAALYNKFYAELTRRDHLVGVGLTLVALGTLLPLVVLGSSRSESRSVLGLLVTAVLVGAFIYGLYRLALVWRDYSEVGILRIVGVATVWLFLLRYWVLPMIGPLSRGAVGQALGDTIRNLIWLLRFDANLGIIMRYDRFLFVGIVALVAGVYVLAEITAQSPFGRVLKAIREDEDVATALGKNTFTYKVQSMALGSGIAGLAGGLTAIQFQALSWSIFRVEVTFIVLLMVIIGGTANNRGAILGAAIYWAFSRGTTDLAAFFPTAASSSIAALRRVIIGVLLIIILYYRPEGLWGEEGVGSE